MDAALKLREQPEIEELFRVLEGNGLAKERQEVGNLVECLDGMEEQFNQVLKELKEVRGQLAQIQDSGVKAAAGRIAERVEKTVHDIGKQIKTVKQNLIQAAKNTVESCREKGAWVLQKAVAAMKIPSALSLLKEALGNGRAGMEKEAAKMGALSGELKEARRHLGNIGRLFVGKETKEPEQTNPDKGITVKIQKAFTACAAVFSGMEQRAGRAMKKAEKFVERGTEKTSVRNELRHLKEKRTKTSRNAMPDRGNIR